MMHTRKSERGATLVVSLVFLLIFLVLALSIFRGSLTSSQAIGNMQWRNEAISVANEAIDRLLSSPRVATQASIVTKDVVDSGGYKYDVDNDGRNDFVVDFPVVGLDASGIPRRGPQCLRVTPVPPASLDPDREADAACFGSAGAGGLAVEGTAGATPLSGPASLCADSEWSMTVRARDPSTDTSVDVVQGFAVRLLTVSVPECN